MANQAESGKGRIEPPVFPGMELFGDNAEIIASRLEAARIEQTHLSAVLILGGSQSDRAAVGVLKTPEQIRDFTAAKVASFTGAVLKRYLFPQEIRRIIEGAEELDTIPERTYNYVQSLGNPQAA